ncbi:plasma membrane H+-ATPase, partial [Achlya hypogyna]
MKQVRECSATYSPSECGELDGSVYKNGSAPSYDALTINRNKWIKAYEEDYNEKSKNGKFQDIFEHLKGSHINDLEKEPTAKAVYDQFVMQYTANGTAVQDAKNGTGVSFVGHNYLPLTNGVSYCDFMWGYSNFNTKWTKGSKNIGPGMQKKDGILRSLIYTQVSISGQALIFVTRTAGINTWFFAEK